MTTHQPFRLTIEGNGRQARVFKLQKRAFRYTIFLSFWDERDLKFKTATRNRYTHTRNQAIDIAAEWVDRGADDVTTITTGLPSLRGREINAVIVDELTPNDPPTED